MKILFDLKCIHLKTGKEYFIGSNSIINCTNSQADQKMVIYSDGVNIFVREEKEFNEKFKLSF